MKRQDRKKFLRGLEKPKPPQNDSNTEGKAKEPNAVDSQSDIHAGTIRIEITESLLLQHQEERKEDTREKKRQLFWTRVAAGLVFLYTLVAAWQGYETRRSVSTAREANTLLEESTRGRLSLKTKFQEMPVSGQHIVVQIETANVGHTLANVGGNGSSRIGLDLPSGAMPVDEPPLNSIVEPGAPFEINLSTLDTVSQKFLDALPTMAEDIGDHRHATQFFFGRIAYETLGHRHEMEFCFYVIKADKLSRLGTGSLRNEPFILRACSKWNSSD